MAGTLQDLRPKQTSVKPKRSRSVVIVVVGIHIFFIWALALGLAGTAVEQFQNIDAALIEDAVQDDAPPPPPPDFVPPPPVIAPPEITIDLTTAPVVETTITQVVTEVPVEAPPPPPPPPTPARPTTSHAVTERDYPPISIRLQEQGTVQIRYLVTVSGEVGDVEILESSGSDRLDQAAINMVQRRWKFEPATLNGVPVAVWQQAVVIFRLR